MKILKHIALWLLRGRPAMEGAATQRFPTLFFVLPPTNGRAGRDAFLSGSIFDSAFLLSMGGRHPALRLLPVAHVAHRTGFQHP